MNCYHSLRITAFLFLFSLLGGLLLAQGVTTASMQGVVVDQEGKGLEGVTILALHEPTGTRYGAISRAGGQFNLPNVRVGGPYEVRAMLVGYGEEKVEGIYLSLGQRLRLNFQLFTADFQAEEVLITTEVSALGGVKTGSETVVSESQISQLPTVSRDLTDFLRLTPQATLTEDGDGEQGFSVAGQNNRFNSVFIDGAISNDVFGLTDQGTNGGQAGVSPISMDAIEQFNIVVAPYDVTIGGFSGAGVNAVTRSGSNEVEGSVYYLWRNERLAGQTPLDNPLDDPAIDSLRSSLPAFQARTAGFRVGAPLVEDKVFIFLNAEVERRQTPQPYTFIPENYRGNATLDQLNQFANKLRGLGYEPGTFTDNLRTVDAEKFLAKLDWNLSENSRLSLRHSYSRGQARKVNASNDASINFSNIYEFFPSTTHSSALELNSVLGEKAANKLILGFTSVRDDRDPLGEPFPYLIINDGTAAIEAGSEQFSTANNLQQDVFTLTNNLNLYRGRHTFTLGTHNEFYSIFNLFVRQNFGVYEYNSLSDFLNDAPPAVYYRSYSLVDDGIDGRVGDEIDNAAARFNAMQLGFYAQDEINLASNFSLTLGLRLDVPIFMDNPPVDAFFNQEAAGEIGAFYDLQGAQAGQMPDPQLLLAPRVGFNYDVGGRGQTRLRGGAGIFTSRLPLVWAGGSHTNNGVSVGGVFEFDPTLANGDPISFRPDPANQYTASDFGGTDPVPSGQMDLFAADLKYPQVFRASLALDQELPGGFTASAEAIFSKTLNSIYYLNVNLKPDPIGNFVGADDRPRFDRRDEIVPQYDRILLGLNTSEGYTFNASFSLSKSFRSGLGAFVAYNYGYAEALNDLTSSQNSSQWRNMEVVGSKNELVVSQSDFSMGHRVVANLSYQAELGDHLGATLSLFYNGQSGEVFSYVYGGSRADALTNQDSRDFTDLIYVPRDASEIQFVGTADEQAAQWNALDAFIEQDPYLSTRRGMYAERNGARTPATHIVDARFLLDFKLKAGGKQHLFQFSADIFNLTHLLNKNWGRRYRSVFNGVQLFTVEEVNEIADGQYEARFAVDPADLRNRAGEYDTRAVLNIDDAGTLSSRWQGQLGVRYIF
jgi:hypothetical protein